MTNTFVEWQGESGTWYLHTACRIGVDPLVVGPVNYIYARRNFDGTITPLYIGQTADLKARWRDHVRDGLLTSARKHGFNELHLHFLARSEMSRFDVETDLRNGHVTLLNQQKSRASKLFGAGRYPARPVPQNFGNNAMLGSLMQNRRF
jgi:predicted GIY-YIG superfamily endonuclease